MEKSFARKIDGKPLFNSLIFGAAVGTFTFIITHQDYRAGIIVGILTFLIQSIVVYPRSLPTLYGFWKITDKNVYYYDYSTWKKRISAIFLPVFKKQDVVSFEDVMSYSLVVNKKSKTNQVTPHFIVLRLDNGHNVALDLSWNLSKSGSPGEDVEWAVDFINSKLGQKTVKVFQILN